jgi:hypothetical protein
MAIAENEEGRSRIAAFREGFVTDMCRLAFLRSTLRGPEGR